MADELLEFTVRVRNRLAAVGDIDAVKSAVNRLNTEASKTNRISGTASTGIGAFAKAVRGAGTLIKYGAEGAAAGIVALVAVGEKLYKSAADAQNTQRKYHDVFAELTPQVDSFIKTTNQKYGVPTKELQDAAALFGIFGKSAGVAHAQLPVFSTSLVRAGEDLAAFHNIPVDTAFKALQSGMAGMIRPLRNYGIFMSDAAIKEEAVAMGLIKSGGNALDAKAKLESLTIAQTKHNTAVSKYGANSVQAVSAQASLDRAQSAVDKGASKVSATLTDQQKVLARQHFIIRNLGDANGALARMIDNPAQQLRVFRGRLLDLTRTIGMFLLPGINSLIKALNIGLSGAVKWIQDRTQRWGVIFQLTLDRIKRAITDAIAAFKTSGFTGMAKNLDESVGAGGRVRDVLLRIQRAAQDLADIWRKILYPAIRDTYNLIAGFVVPVAFVALSDLLHLAAVHGDGLRQVLYLIAGLLVANKVAVIALNIVEGIQTVLTVALAGAKYGLVGAYLAAAGAADANAVGAGVLNGVMTSGLVVVTYHLVAWAALAGQWAWAAIKAGVLAIKEGALATVTAVAEIATWAYNAAIVETGIAQFVAAAASEAWMVATLLLKVAMDALPIFLLITGIALLVAGVIYAYKHFGWFRDAVDATGRFFKTVFVGIFDFIRDHWKVMLAGILGPLALAALLIFYHWHRIRDVAVGAFDFIRDHWKLLTVMILGPFAFVVIGVITYFSQIKNAVMAVIDFVIALFKGLYHFMLGLFTLNPGEMFQGIREAFSGVVNFMKDIWNDFVSAIPAIHVSILGKHLDLDLGKTLHIGDIKAAPKAHSGGYVTEGGTVNMLPGEELVVLPPAASVVPLSSGGIEPGTLSALMAQRPIHTHVHLNGKEIATAVTEGHADQMARR